MDRDDDVGRLFSWLQTPEFRYREFADAPEMMFPRTPEQVPPLLDPPPETNGAVAHVEPAGQQDNKRSLDAVFRRLSCGCPQC
jgi:hypothetical protein